ncbi:MAG: branched-chain amino acid ABC transporter substrate-binding protein [Actinobacteria bacterium]|nr:branched-chain amino acid ABC transporter substrate-binding protein [Actinomycetota bacterium]
MAMSRKYLKVTALSLVFLFLGTLTLTGCGQETAPDQKGKEAAKVVKIGFIGPLTGPNAYQGVGARNAFDLAIKQANESKEFPYKIEMVALDDASNPGTGASAATKITSDAGVVAASGHWNSPVAEATIPIFKNAKIPFIIWGAISPKLTSVENYPIVTRVAPTSVQENLPLAKFAIDERGYKKWAVISDTTVYGKNNTVAWKDEVSRRSGAEILSVDEIQVGQTDFRPILTKIKPLNPEAVYFGGVVMEGALIKRQMSEMGLKIPLFAISGIGSEKYIEAAGNEGAEGTVSSKPGKDINKLPGGQKFMEAYQKAGYSEPYGVYGPYAYDAANIILAALKKVGPDRAKLIDAIAKIEHSGLLGATKFNEIGQTTNVLATILVVQDGKWVPWEDSEYASGKRSLPKK